jgi:GH24 family phage-related lysozyme (muramidase)
MKSIEEQLIDYEGFEPKVYHCPAGKLTIGVGRNLSLLRVKQRFDPQIILNLTVAPSSSLLPLLVPVPTLPVSALGIGR